MLKDKLSEIANMLQSDLESPQGNRSLGTGWISGVLGLLCAASGLLLIVALRHPTLFTYPELADLHAWPGLTFVIYGFLIVSYILACTSLLLRTNKILGLVAMTITLLATFVGSLPPTKLPGEGTGLFFGLDFFVLNILFAGLLFIPLERLLPHDPSQGIFRNEWREDLFYYLVSSLFVQLFTFFALVPSEFLLRIGDWSVIHHFFSSLPWLLQVGAIMIFSDFAQYWAHRTFHHIPFLWHFHAVHHSVKQLDWIAGSRMHFVEIIILRALTATPMFLLGFQESAIQAYILIVYVYATFIHSNIGIRFGFIENILAVPRYHHWHHGLEKEAIDVNFAIHFPVLDRVFRTYYFPKGKWPTGYGIGGDPVPKGFIKQFIYPFKRH